MAEPAYRAKIEPESPQYRSDVDVLRAVREHGQATPKLLAQSRYRENVLRLQCRDLCRLGALVACSHDTFEITELGIGVLAGDDSLPRNHGVFDLEACPSVQLPPAEWRITDFDILDAETIKEINLGLFEEAEEDGYGWVDGDPELTRRRIQNVKDFRIDRLMSEFPTTEPLPQQCAHWMRAYAGLHFFPDANHRTGMNTLQILFEENIDSDSLPISDDIERFVLQSKLTRHLNSRIEFDTLWKRDAHYTLWHQYFRNLLCDVPDRHPISPPTEHLRQTLRFARKNSDGF